MEFSAEKQREQDQYFEALIDALSDSEESIKIPTTKSDEAFIDFIDSL